MPTSPAPSTHSQAGRATAPPAHIGDVLALLDADQDLGPSRRKALAGALRTLCSALAREATVVPASMPKIDALLKAVPAPARGRSKKTIDNARSLAKSALLLYSPPLGLPPRGTSLRPEWQALADSLPDLRLRNGLSRFMGIASFHAVDPAEVNNDVVDRIVEVVGTVNWGRDAKPFRTQVTRLWNEAVASVPGWPQRRLVEPATKPTPAHLPVSAFATSFQDDLASYLAWAAGADPLAEDAPARPLKPSTVRLRREQLRIAASTLAAVLGRPSAITSLAELVAPDHAKRVLTAMLAERPDHKPSAFMRGVGMAFLAVARHWVKAPPADIDALRFLQRRMGSNPSGLTEKNRALVRQFEDRQLRAALLVLPATLRKQVQTRRMSPDRRLQMMQVAVAIELLLVAPMRLQNLVVLQLDHQLQWPNGRGGALFIVLRDDETKNDEPLEYEVPIASRALLEEYVDRYRAHAAANDSPNLFIHRGGKPVSAATLRDRITKTIQRELNVKMTPHQFRHLAAAMFLDANPGAIGVVRDLLGHKSMKTTTNFYAGRRSRKAGEVWDKFLTGARTGS